MLTDAQAEAAARKLCELRGVNPDETVAHGSEPDARGVVHDVMLYSPAWRLALSEVRAFEVMQAAIEHGKAQP